MSFCPPSQRKPIYSVGESLWECSAEGVHPLEVIENERFGYVSVRRTDTGKEVSLPLQHVQRQAPTRSSV